MIKHFKDKIFNIGFGSGMTLLLVINYLDYLEESSINIADMTLRFGFPFPMYEWGGFFSHEEILWFGLIANVLFGLGFSFLLSFIFKFVWSKILKRNLK